MRGLEPLRHFVSLKWTRVWRFARAHLPDRVAALLSSSAWRFSAADVPAPVRPPSSAVRLYIAPVNYAGQAYAWARASERLPEVGAINMQFRGSGDLGFRADYSVSDVVFARSGDWARRQRRVVAKHFTHVLVEAERPMFGWLFNGAVEREVRWLQRRGVRVGMISHGTDLRLPSRHAQLDEWSPFRDESQSWSVLESKARSNKAILERLNVPVFVSTPELLLDWTEATWLPLCVDSARWRTDAPLLSRAVPVVVHAPTNAAVKGTALIEPVLNSLSEAGVIHYRRIENVPAASMPEVYATSDIVLEQFALGMYSTTAVEAMAAGRVVIAHVHDQVRQVVREVTGWEIPVVQATPATLDAVLQDICERTEHYREIAAKGPEFVEAVHTGELSARRLASFLGSSAS